MYVYKCTKICSFIDNYYIWLRFEISNHQIINTIFAILQLIRSDSLWVSFWKRANFKEHGIISEEPMLWRGFSLTRVQACPASRTVRWDLRHFFYLRRLHFLKDSSFICFIYAACTATYHFIYKSCFQAVPSAAYLFLCVCSLHLLRLLYVISFKNPF